MKPHSRGLHGWLRAVPERLLISQRNAVAVAIYVGQTLLGLSYFTTLNQSAAVVGLVGAPGHALWAAVSVLGGILGLLGVWHGPKNSAQRTQDLWLVIEGTGCVLMALGNGLYVAALFASTVEPLGVLDTKIRAAVIAAAAVARLVQIRRDRTRYRSRTGR